MARSWQRLASMVAAVGLFFIALSYFRATHNHSSVQAPAEEKFHQQDLPYRPQGEKENAPNESAVVTEVEDVDNSSAVGSILKDGVTQPQRQDNQNATEEEDLAPPTGTPNSSARPLPVSPSSTSPTSTSTSVPTPSSTELSKIIVMGKTRSEDTDWVGRELPDWQNAIYAVDLPDNANATTGYRTKMNKAKEAMPYLTYITESYPEFPDIVVFIHAHRDGYPAAWHTDAPDNDAVQMLHQLRLDVVKERGYVNLRCIETPGCPDEIQPWRYPPDPDKVPEQVFPYIYAEFFNRTLAETQAEIQAVATPCCAQFAVSREQILKRSKEDYVRYLKYLEESKYNDDHLGRVLEYMWHIMFGQDAVSCPNTQECWCEVYGRCDPHWGLRPGRGGSKSMRFRGGT